MNKLISLVVLLSVGVLGVYGVVLAGEKEYQDCLRMQQQGYAIHCIPPSSETFTIDQIQRDNAAGIDGRIKEKKVVELPQYQVKITIIYNAVDARKAVSLAENIMKLHGEACKVHIDIKKVGDNGLNVGLTSDATDLVLYNGTTIQID